MVYERWSDRDISDYLDGQLAPDRLAIFEKALAESNVLRQRVDAWQKTLTLLHETPLRESPRNYLLTPSMVANHEPARTPKRRTVGIMRLATSLTAAAFVLTLGLNVMTHGIAPAEVYMSQETLTFSQNDSVQVQEMEAPVALFGAVTPESGIARAQEKALIVEEPVMELAAEAPQPEGDMEAAPGPDLEGEVATGIGAGTEQLTAPEAAENLSMLEEEVEQEQVLMGKAADTVEPTATAPVEDEVLPSEEDVTVEEAVLATPPEDPMALTLPLESKGTPSRGAIRQRAWWQFPWLLSLWAPASLGIMTLLLLGVTLYLSKHRP